MSIEDDWDAQKFYIDRSIRYHDRREHFFAVCHRWVALLGVLSSSAAISLVMSPNPKASIWFSAVVAFASGLDLVLGFSAKERLHHDLRMRFFDLMAMTERPPSPEALSEIRAAQCKIERDEPPIYRIVDLASHNAACRARGFDLENDEDAKHFYRLSWWHRMVAHVRKGDNVKIERLSDYRARKQK